MSFILVFLLQSIIKPFFFAPISAQRICMAFCRGDIARTTVLCASSMEAQRKEENG